MTHKNKLPGVITLAAMLAAPSAIAQTGGPFDLTWNSIDAGAAVSAGGPYQLTGVIGQPDAAPALAGGPYTLAGGVLQPGNPSSHIAGWSLY